MKIITKRTKSFLLLYILVFLIFLIRINFTADYLEDWDSVQFALALHNYSITDHQPHPPGYPLYILFGKLLNIFFDNDTKSLTFMSSFLGSLSIIPLFFLAKKIFNQSVAILTIIFFIFTPLVWILSATALTDIPGFFFLVSISYLIYITKDNYKYFVIVSFIAGLILGIRTNSILIIVSLLILVLLHNRNLKLTILSAFAFLCGVAIWLVPLIIFTGPNQLISSYSSISNYVIWHDVFLGNKLDIKNIAKIKLNQFWYLLKIGYTQLFSIIGLISIIYLFCQKRFWRSFKYQFLGIWIIAHLIPQFTIYNLEMPRHTLPLLPPVLILISSLCIQFNKKYNISMLLIFIFVIVLFLQSWSQISRFKSQIPPTIQPIKFVKKNINFQQSIIISSLTYRHFQYYAPEYTLYQSSQISQIIISPDKTIIIDNLQLKDKIKNFDDFKIIKNFEFIGDKDIFPRVSKTNLYILKKK